MPGSGDSIKYKSLVITLLGVVVALVSFIGVGALSKLDAMQTTVLTLQIKKQNDDLEIARLNDRMAQIERQLIPQIDYLTRWMTDTFGQPRPKSKAQFGAP